MLRFVLPVILIGVGAAVLFVFTNPIYGEIKTLRNEAASYDEALGNSAKLEKERDKLTKTFNDMDPNNLIKLQKLLPENIDNIRLILEIEEIARPYGMALRDVKYSADKKKEEAAKNSLAGEESPQIGGAVQPGLAKDFGVWDLEFSTVGAYGNFLNFTRDLESNLRIVDISSVQFSSVVESKVGAPAGGNAPKNPLDETYKYNFRIKTYWLKN